MIQIIILVSGAVAIYLLNTKNRWGCVVGLLSSPFWLYETATHEQWGMFALSIFYMYAWIIGMKTYWYDD